MSLSADSLPLKSPLISVELEGQLKSVLAPVSGNVTLTCIADDGDKSLEMAIFLKDLASLSEHLAFKLLAPGEDPAADAVLDPAYLPATGFFTDRGFERMVFHGVPGGREMNSFAMALLTAGGAAKPLDKPTLKDIARIKGPVRADVCVSLTCSHCAKTVMNAQRVAYENEAVSVHMIDANLYPALVEQYKIERVPIMIAAGKMVGAGEMTMPEICTALRKLK